MVYQTYQEEDILEMLNANDTVEAKVFSRLIHKGMSEKSVMKLLGGVMVRQPSFWMNPKTGEPTTKYNIIISKLTKDSKFFITKEGIQKNPNFLFNDLGVGITTNKDREALLDQIGVNEAFADFLYNARLFGKIINTNTDNLNNPSFAYVTRKPEKADKTSIHELQFLSEKNFVEGELMDNINPKIKTIIIPRGNSIVSDPLYQPILLERAKQLSDLGYNFGLEYDNSGKYLFLTPEQLPITEGKSSLMILSPSYAEKFIPSDRENNFSLIDLISGDTYKINRIEKYGIDIELGVIELKNKQINAMVSEVISQKITKKGVAVSEAVKNAFTKSKSSHDVTKEIEHQDLFDLNQMINAGSFSELNEISKNALKFSDYIDMISSIAKECMSETE